MTNESSYIPSAEEIRLAEQSMTEEQKELSHERGIDDFDEENNTFDLEEVKRWCSNWSYDSTCFKDEFLNMIDFRVRKGGKLAQIIPDANAFLARYLDEFEPKEEISEERKAQRFLCDQPHTEVDYCINKGELSWILTKGILHAEPEVIKEYADYLGKDAVESAVDEKFFRFQYNDRDEMAIKLDSELFAKMNKILTDNDLEPIDPMSDEVIMSLLATFHFFDIPKDIEGYLSGFGLNERTFIEKVQDLKRRKDTLKMQFSFEQMEPELLQWIYDSACRLGLADIREAEESMTPKQQEMTRVRESEFLMNERKEQELKNRILNLLQAADFDAIGEAMRDAYNRDGETIRSSSFRKDNFQSEQEKLREIVTSPENLDILQSAIQEYSQSHGFKETYSMIAEYLIDENRNARQVTESFQSWIYDMAKDHFMIENMAMINFLIPKFGLHERYHSDPELREQAKAMFPEMILRGNHDNWEYGVQESFQLFADFGMSKAEIAQPLEDGVREYLRQGDDENAIAIVERFDLEPDFFQGLEMIEQLIIECAAKRMLENARKNQDDGKLSDYVGACRLLTRFDLWEKFYTSEKLKETESLSKKVRKEIRRSKIEDLESETRRKEYASKQKELLAELETISEGEFIRREARLASKIFNVVQNHMSHRDQVNREVEHEKNAYELRQYREEITVESVYDPEDEEETDDLEPMVKRPDRRIKKMSQKAINALWDKKMEERKAKYPDDWFYETPEENCYDNDGPEYTPMCNISKDQKDCIAVTVGHWSYTLLPYAMSYIETYLTEEEIRFLGIACLKYEIERRKSALKNEIEALRELGIEPEIK